MEEDDITPYPHQILQQNTRTNQVSQSFDAQRKALKESVINVEVQRLNKSQVAFAEKVQKIKKEAEVIRAMKLSNNKAEQELESEAERVEEVR